jgi:hypothetical protein
LAESYLASDRFPPDADSPRVNPLFYLPGSSQTTQAILLPLFFQTKPLLADQLSFANGYEQSVSDDISENACRMRNY